MAINTVQLRKRKEGNNSLSFEVNDHYIIIVDKNINFIMQQMQSLGLISCNLMQET
jgi:hypothetical protein